MLIPFVREAEMTSDLYKLLQMTKGEEHQDAEQANHAIFPATKLRQAHNMEQSVISLAEPVPIPVHNYFPGQETHPARNRRLKDKYYAVCTPFPLPQ
mmetsp:Transcript_12344/g.29319  ORF Transcript_12344/g.29319 Transcript_12344/m.29319 type:complete len:97 (+) Transcript_12344:497-787(+)